MDARSNKLNLFAASKLNGEDVKGCVKDTAESFSVCCSVEGVNDCRVAVPWQRAGGKARGVVITGWKG